MTTTVKMCPRCKTVKVLDEFYNNKASKDGKDYCCKRCKELGILSWRKRNPEKYKNAEKLYRVSNKEKRAEQTKQWRKLNKEKYKACRKQYDASYYQKNREKIIENVYKWQQENPDRKKAIMRKAMKKVLSTPNGKLNNSMRRDIGLSLKGKKGGRKWQTLVDYSLLELKRHLEKQFTPKMTWKNYGPYWHIDHIIPISAFNFKTPEDIDFKRCWLLENLRPLEAKANISKGAKLFAPFQPSLLLAESAS